MRRLDVEQDGALAGALLAGVPGAGLEACEVAALADVLAGATLDCVAAPAALEL